jgi:hypothetical protein
MNQGATFKLITVQFAFWMTVGIGLAILALADLRIRRDADSLLLTLWMAGTFVFAGYVNWITNARALLPMAVPAGILIARQLERRYPAPARLMRLTAVPVALAAVLSFCVTWADAHLANAARLGAEASIAKYSPRDRTVWFRGHWGFQWYMEHLGGKAQDLRQSTSFAPRDVIVLPTINTDRGEIEPPDWARIQDVLRVPSSNWISTMGYGGGFYGDAFGPMPFAFGPVPPEEIAIIGVKQELLPPELRDGASPAR